METHRAHPSEVVKNKLLFLFNLTLFVKNVINIFNRRTDWNARYYILVNAVIREPNGFQRVNDPVYDDVVLVKQVQNKLDQLATGCRKDMFPRQTKALASHLH